MFLPDYFDRSTLCGVAFDSEGNLWGQYFIRNYCGRTAATPEYSYGMATEKSEDFKLGSYACSPNEKIGVKRFTKRPATDCTNDQCGYEKHASIDKCEC